VALACAIALPLLACGAGSLAGPCALSLPETPASWRSLLGEPSWQVEWIAPQGVPRSLVCESGAPPPAVEVIEEWASPILAWPFWPDKGIAPREMHPAGALYPLDYAAGGLALTWQGGVEAGFYERLAAYAGGAPERAPWRFDWGRFREALRSESLDAALQADPWLADWDSIAAKTAQDTFRGTSLKPAETVPLAAAAPPGLYAGPSPFAPALEAPPGGLLPLRVTPTPGAWFSETGRVRASSAGWYYRAYENDEGG
jgi:hypothetical protein